MKIKLIVIGVVVAFFQGCATLNKDQCLQADWKMIGQVDGQKGKSSARIGDHHKACAKYGVLPNLQEYNAGHNIGIQQYCNYENGYNIGENGSANRNVCPEKYAAAFNQGYNTGKQLFNERREISRKMRLVEKKQQENEFLIGSKEQEIAELNKKITLNNELLVAKGKNKHQRLTYFLTKKKLGKKLGHKRNEMADLYETRDILQSDYEHLTADYSNLKSH